MKKNKKFSKSFHFFFNTWFALQGDQRGMNPLQVSD